MPMYDPRKKPIHFPFTFHDALREIDAKWRELGKTWDREGLSIFPVTKIMTQDDYAPRPATIMDVKKKLKTEVNRWNAFKTCLRKNPDHHLAEVVDKLKLSPQIRWSQEEQGFQLVIAVSHSEVAWLEIITSDGSVKKC